MVSNAEINLRCFGQALIQATREQVAAAEYEIGWIDAERGRPAPDPVAEPARHQGWLECRLAQVSAEKLEVM